MNAEPLRVSAAEEYRQAPYDVEIEQALLGAILIDNAALERVRHELTADHFYDPLHQRMYRVMQAQIDSGITITPLTLTAAMKADPGLIEVSGHVYLSGLADAAPAMPNVRDYARILRDLAARRRLINIGEEIVNAAYEAPLEEAPHEQVARAEAALHALRQQEADRIGNDAPALSAADWCGRDLPEPDRLLGHLLSTTCRVMLVAPIRRIVVPRLNECLSCRSQQPLDNE